MVHKKYNKGSVMKYGVILMLIFTSLLATVQQPMHKLTLQEALQIVQEENLEIQVANYEEKIKDFEARIAAGYSYGSLDLVSTAMRSNDAGNVFGFKLASREATFSDFGFSDFLSHSPSPMATSVLSVQPRDLNYPETRNHYQTKVVYKVPLYTGGELQQYRRISKALHKLSKLDAVQAKQQKLFETKKSFYDLSLLDTFIENLEQIKANIQTLEEMVVEMIAEGYAKKVDLLEVQTKKASVVRMINKAKANERLAYEYLSFLLNRDVSSIKYVFDLAPLPARKTQSYVQNSIDVQKAQLGLKMRKMAVEQKRSSFLPKVGAFAEYGSADNEFLNDFRDKDSYTFGAKLTWNLFNGGIDDNKLQIAKIKRAQMRQKLDLAKKGIALKVDRIKTNIQSCEFDIESLRKEKELKNEVYENYLGRYQEKLVAINDVLIKQSELIETVLKLQKEKNSRNEKVFALEKILVGER